MVQLAHATPATKSKTTTAQNAALLLAGLLVVMAVGQLFAFEEFIPLIESFGMGGGTSSATVLATAIVVTEVFALPFLLRMTISPLMRIVSMLCGWAVVVLWLYITVFLNTTMNSVTNIGLLGTKIHLPVGWWAVCFVVALGILAAWAAWGMWPRITTPRAHKK